MQLRPYQQRTIDLLYQWFRNNPEGNPCVVMATGSGKSHVIAALCKDALQSWPETRILMLTASKELIEQNYEKLLQHWPGAPVGIVSASIGRKEYGEPITFAGIQSVRKSSKLLGPVDLIIVDECDNISHKEEGGYRKLIAELTEINPALRVIGCTATPFRLGHGLITDAPAIFKELIEPISIVELIEQGYLAPLKSKSTEQKQDTSGVKKRGGEFVESELQAAVDTEDQNRAIVAEVINRAEDRKHWLFFCAGVAHAYHVRDELIAQGITAETVTGETSKGERDRIIADFKAGRIQALTNANVLTVGFDFPDIDLIAMLRPTMSPRLYVQCAGRGLRPKSHSDHCLFLDFAGVVAAHGPITCVQPPNKKSKSEGTAPVKTCKCCNEICHASVRICHACGAEFPAPEKPPLALREDDIMGLEPLTMACTGWAWAKHVSRSSGQEMLKVSYWGGLLDLTVTEYLPIFNQGYAGGKSFGLLMDCARKAGIEVDITESLEDIADMLNKAQAPAEVDYRRDGKFYRVLARRWPAFVAK